VFYTAITFVIIIIYNDSTTLNTRSRIQNYKRLE